jgi:hypothetical protein
MGKRKGHFCHVCGRHRPNEAFSGGGHRRHVCKECSRMPKEEREAIEQADEIFGFLTQSHISKKNLARLRILYESDNPRTTELADIVLQVALVKPYKKKRMSFLAQKHPELLSRMEETGLAIAGHW